MKQTLMNIGILVTFYLTIIIGVLLLNARCKEINNFNENNSYVAMND